MSTIMVVDDEIMITKTLAVLLKMTTKQKVITYNKPEDALKSKELEDNKVDLIISDFIMPQMNGIEFLLRAKELSPTTESILLTGYADKENAIKSINEVGVYYYLEKPWNNDELVKIVSNALDKKRLSNELQQEMIKLEISNKENKRLYELVSKEFDEEKSNTKSLIISLANLIEAKDPYTDGHTRRVSLIAKKLGEEFNLSPKEIDTLEIVGMVHDIGKVAIPDHVLNKPSKLSDEEFDLMKTHTVIGEKIVKPLNSFKEYLLPIKNHHEKLNGSGYPNGLKKEEISFVTRIITVVDIFDALYSDRPYRKKMPIEKAIHILREEVGIGNLDKDIVDKLIQLIENNELDDIFQL